MPECIICHQIKDSEEFRHKSMKERCHACVLLYYRNYRQTHRERIKKQQSANFSLYRLKHRTRLLARHKMWRARNIAKYRVYAKTHRMKYPEKVATRKKEYARLNADKIKQQRKAYVEQHPERKSAAQAMHRARKRHASINDLTMAQWLEIQAAYAYRCVYCPPDCWRCQQQKHKLTQDHLTPLSKGGNHTASNIVPSCAACNARKGPRNPLIPVQPLLLTIAPPKKRKAG